VVLPISVNGLLNEEATNVEGPLRLSERKDLKDNPTRAWFIYFVPHVLLPLAVKFLKVRDTNILFRRRT
jgi:hypothetical protein